MSLYDLFNETFFSLTSNKVRSSLTILGIVVGIAAVILLVAIGQGAQASITNSINSAGANLLTVQPGGQRRFGPGGPEAGAQANAKLTEADAAVIKALPNVASVSPVAQGSYPVATGQASGNTRVTGVTAVAAVVSSIDTSMGTFITEEDVRSLAKVAVLGPTSVTNFFGDGSNPLGQVIRINGVRFTVIGVTKSKGGTGFGNADAVVYVPLTTMQSYLTGNTDLDSINVEAASAGVISGVQQSITDALMSAHHITDTTKQDFNIQSQADILSTASTITGTFTALLASIAGISLLVGGIGIMNMMLTTVTERTREIGLRKAIGAKRRDISRQFLAEAVALTLVGGVLGIGLGSLISIGVNATGLVSTSISFYSILIAFGVSALIGIVFGYYPARRAAALNPIDALRYE
jgi:putative ABC transport system permease protein